MSHLAEVYAKDLGVKIGKPYFKPHFFPVVSDNYITIHTDDNVQSKHYDYWDLVITIVKGAVPDTKFIQIGSGKEPKILKADQFIKTSSIKQSAYIIQNALVHVGIDSSPVHIASHLNKPIVALYAHTYANTCDPLWSDKDKVTIIESDRNKQKPSFSLKEGQKNINLIKPEQVANAILHHLGVEPIIFKTLHLGKKLKDDILEVVPDHPYDIKSKNLWARLDLLHKEENVFALLENNSIGLRTSKPVSEELLRSKKIVHVIYISDSFDPVFVDLLIKLGKSFKLLCNSNKNLSEQRSLFFDQEVFDYDLKSEIKKKKDNLPLDKFSYSTNKKILKNKKVYDSYYAMNGSKKIDDFYVDLDYMYVYSLSNE